MPNIVPDRSGGLKKRRHQGGEAMPPQITDPREEERGLIRLTLIHSHQGHAFQLGPVQAQIGQLPV